MCWFAFLHWKWCFILSFFTDVQNIGFPFFPTPPPFFSNPPFFPTSYTLFFQPLNIFFSTPRNPFIPTPRPFLLNPSCFFSTPQPSFSTSSLFFLSIRTPARTSTPQHGKALRNPWHEGENRKFLSWAPWGGGAAPFPPTPSGLLFHNVHCLLLPGCKYIMCK